MQEYKKEVLMRASLLGYDITFRIEEKEERTWNSFISYKGNGTFSLEPQEEEDADMPTSITEQQVKSIFIEDCGCGDHEEDSAVMSIVLYGKAYPTLEGRVETPWK